MRAVKEPDPEEHIASSDRLVVDGSHTLCLADSHRGSFDSSIRIARTHTLQPRTPTLLPFHRVSLPQQSSTASNDADVSAVTKLDSGSTAEMWCVCRLLCPDRPKPLQQIDQEHQGKTSVSDDTTLHVVQDAMALAADNECDDSLLNWNITAPSDSNANAIADGGNCSAHVETNDVCSSKASGSRITTITTNGVEYDGLKEQLAMVEAMVHEMKVGFMTALEHLTSMQDGSPHGTGTGANGLWEELEITCKSHDKQLIEIVQSFNTLKRDVTALTGAVAQVTTAHQSLQSQLKGIQVWQQKLIEELVSNGTLSDKTRTRFSAETDLTTEEVFQSSALLQGPLDTVTNKGSEHTDCQTLARSQGDQTRVTAAACKSLSLIQALAAQCRGTGLSDSSEEDSDTSVSRTIHTKHENIKKKNLYYNWKGSRKSFSHLNLMDSVDRRQSVQEIVDAEQEYCMQLWTLINVFQVPLQDGHYMSSRQLCLLFPAPLSDLHDQHCQILLTLKDRLVQWSFAGVVGDVFAKMVDSANNLLGLYQEYVESLPGSISCLHRQLAASKSFRGFLKAQKESSASADLTSLLILPLQRIPKCMLQLQQVLCYTKEDHPDFYNMQMAVTKLQEFVEHFSQEIAHTTYAISEDVQDLKRLEQTTSCLSTEPSFAQLGSAFQQSPLPSCLSACSQPDLSYSGSTTTVSSLQAKKIVPQVLSQSTLPPSGGRSVRVRHFRIKRYKNQGLDYYLSPFQNLESLQHRSGSAIDFVSQRGLPQTQEGDQNLVRPHSVLGHSRKADENGVIHVYSQVIPRAAHGDHQASDSGMSSSSSTARQEPPPGFPQPYGRDRHWAVTDDGKISSFEHVDNEEDDTRTVNVCSSEVSPFTKSGNTRSQDVHDETDNSEEYSQEELAACLSQHLGTAGGAGVPVASYDDALCSPIMLYQQVTTRCQVGDRDNGTRGDQKPGEANLIVISHGKNLKSASLQQPLLHQHDISSCHNIDTPVPHQEKSSHQIELSNRFPKCLLNLHPEDANNSCENSTLHLQTEIQDGRVHSTVRNPQENKQQEPATASQLEFVLAMTSNNASKKSCFHECDISQASGIVPKRPSLSSAMAANDFVISSDEPVSQILLGNEKGKHWKLDTMKKTSTENEHWSVVDVSSVSKKKAFRTSLKNLFQRKKGSVMLDKLEHEYTKQLVRQTLASNIPNTLAAIQTISSATKGSHPNSHFTRGLPCTTWSNLPVGSDNRYPCIATAKGNLGSIDSMNNNIPQCHNNDGLFAKIRQSPLVFMHRNKDPHISEQP